MAEDGPVAPGLSYGDVAKKLLNDRLLLTALELHYELIEAGKELPGLREFFSNPSNFEHSSPQNDNISMTLSMGKHVALCFCTLRDKLNVLLLLFFFVTFSRSSVVESSHTGFNRDDQILRRRRQNS